MSNSSIPTLIKVKVNDVTLTYTPLFEQFCLAFVSKPIPRYLLPLVLLWRRLIWAVCMQGSVTSLRSVQTTNNGAIEAMFRFTLWHRQQEERMEIYFELQRQSLDNHLSAREPPSMVGEVFSCPTKGVNYIQCGCVARCVSVYTVTPLLSTAVKYIWYIQYTVCTTHLYTMYTTQ